MLASVIDGILSSDDEGDEAGDDVDAASGESGGSDEEGEASDGESGDSEDSGADSGLQSAEDEGGSEEAEGDAEAAGVAQQGASAADPFSRKQLQEKATAAAAAGAAAVQQPTRPPPEEGATVFIRGLPLDVTKEQVFTKMKVGGRRVQVLLLLCCPGQRGGGWLAWAESRRRSDVRQGLQSCCPGPLCRPTAPCAPAAWWWTRRRASSRAPPSWTSTRGRQRTRRPRRAPRAGVSAAQAPLAADCSCWRPQGGAVHGVKALGRARSCLPHRIRCTAIPIGPG